MSETLDSIDEERKLYNIKCSGGYTCLGFDVCEKKTKEVLAWMSDRVKVYNANSSIVTTFAEIMTKHMPEKGTPEAYDFYERIMELGRKFNELTNERCEAELIPELKGLEGKRVEVTDIYEPRPRRFYVGKSTGWMPCHLEISRVNSHGGPAAMGPYKSVRVIPRMRRY